MKPGLHDCLKLALVGAWMFVAGCERGDAAGQTDDVGDAAAGQEASDRCTLAKAAEIESAIGPHDGGAMEIGNLWGLQGCRWTAKAVQKSESWGDWHEYVEIAAFDGMMDSWARGEAEGDPAPEVAPGALYDAMGGTLWFDCGGRFCAIYTKIDSGEKREQAAKQLARLVISRAR